jgi:hypothetical protein
MKKTILFAAILLGSFAYKTTSAQLRVGLNVNIATQPVWGPVGYDHAEYYYMPDIDVYYNVSRRQYIYMEQGRWQFAASLPARYHNYDLYSGYKVVINEPTPYRHDQTYRTKYVGYKGNHSQEAIRNSQDSKYFVNKDHPQHNQWKKDNNHAGGKDHGNDHNH